jgi:hypothetical protein
MGLDTKTYWLTDRQSQCDFDLSTMHTAYSLSYVLYDYVTKLLKQQPEVVQNRENEHSRGIGQDEARHRKYNGSLVTRTVISLTTGKF